MKRIFTCLSPTLTSPLPHFFFLLFLFLSPSLLFSEDAPKQTICLNMIVKNESKVITRCLESVLPLIDSWVIVDTGSNDGTQKIIQNFMDIHHIPGELHERPWVNFGHNRQEALQLAKNKADYLLFIDADDILTFPKNYKLPHLTLDVYLVKGKDKGMQFHLWTFVKTSLNWQWHDPIHEYLELTDNPDSPLMAAVLEGIEYHYIHDGMRSKNPSTTMKDIEILTKALKENPNNKRLTYYLAQTYANANNLHKALEYYQKRIEMGGNEQEVFSAMMYKAKIQANLKVDPDILIATYQNAHEFRPSRPEPIYYLAHKARIKGDYQKGYEISKKGIKLPKSTDILDLEESTYDGLLFEHACCALETGKLKECKEVCRVISEKPYLTKEQKANLKALKDEMNNKQLSKEALNVVNKLYGEDS